MKITFKPRELKAQKSILEETEGILVKTGTRNAQTCVCCPPEPKSKPRLKSNLLLAQCPLVKDPLEVFVLIETECLSWYSIGIPLISRFHSISGSPIFDFDVQLQFNFNFGEI